MSFYLHVIFTAVAAKRYCSVIGLKNLSSNGFVYQPKYYSFSLKYQILANRLVLGLKIEVFMCPP